MAVANKKTLPAMFGAAVEYYDVSLYGYLAPVLAPVFFPHFQVTTAYFFYFLVEFFSSLVQILGARWFGRIGDRLGRKKALLSSMLGTSIVTGFMSLIPSYAQLGIFATVLFVLARIGQSFFLGGEYNGGAIYCLEHEEGAKRHGWISGQYCAFTVGGVLCASAVATLVYRMGSSYFRIAYMLSFVMALCAFRWRTTMMETPEYRRGAMETGRPLFFAAVVLVIVSTFVGLLHGIPSRVFNVLLPIQTGIDQKTLMLINTGFLALYMMLMLLCGYVSDKIGVKKIMLLSALSTIGLTFPLFWLIKTNSLLLIVFVKFIYVLLAAAFIGPFHAFSQSVFRLTTRYSQISTCYALGKCLSTLTIAVSFLVYEKTAGIMSVGFILVGSAVMVALALLFSPKSAMVGK